MTRYTTPEQAAADALLLGPPHTFWRAVHSGLVRLVSDPAAGSDALLIQADTLRQFGNDALFRATNPAEAARMIAWANTLTDLAPTRANPIAFTAAPDTSNPEPA